jgi:alkylation response protein AidB-like acyl-CoA dehydrogenase
MTGSLRERVERSVEWYLDTVAVHGKTFVAVTSIGGAGSDPEIERIISEADDRAAAKVVRRVRLKEYPIAHLFADTRVLRILAGANEIMKELVARSL